MRGLDALRIPGDTLRIPGDTLRSVGDELRSAPGAWRATLKSCTDAARALRADRPIRDSVGVERSHSRKPASRLSPLRYRLGLENGEHPLEGIRL